MTDAGSNTSAEPVSGPRPSPDDRAQALRLSVERPRITRLSRKVLAGGTALALLLISGAVLWALRSNHPRSPAPDELYSTDHHNVADGLATLPRDYAGVPHDVPKFGPPLAGDFGRPSIAAEGQSMPIGLDAEQQRANQETEAARISKVFASITGPVTSPHAASQGCLEVSRHARREVIPSGAQRRRGICISRLLHLRSVCTIYCAIHLLFMCSHLL